MPWYAYAIIAHLPLMTVAGFLAAYYYGGGKKWN